MNYDTIIVELLAKVKKDRHDKIVNEMLNKQLLEIKK